MIVELTHKTMTFHSSGRTRPQISNFPKVTYTSKNGEAITFTSETGDMGLESKYRVGDPIAVFHDPAGRHRPMLASWSGVWLPPLMLIGAGGVFLFGAWLVWFAFGDRILKT